MTSEAVWSEHLSEVLRLCSLLSDRALDAQITGRTIPADHAVALAKAAQVLQDHGVEWPPLLTQVLHELAGCPAGTTLEPEVDPLDSDLQGLARFFSGFRKKD